MKAAKPAQKHGGDRKSEKVDQGSVATLKSGRGADYLAARIKRDYSVPQAIEAATTQKRVQAAAEETTGEVLAAHAKPDVQNAHQKAETRAAEAGISLRTQRTLDRLARERPDLLELVKAGALTFQGHFAAQVFMVR